MEEKVGVGDGIQQYSDSANRGASSEAENTIYWKTTACASGSASRKSDNVILQDVPPFYFRLRKERVYCPVIVSFISVAEKPVASLAWWSTI